MADNKRAEVLRTAESLINGDRADTYGSPTESFGRIGRMWGAILNMPDIDPSTVALMMAAMKISRASGQLDHEDSYVDLAGYAALGAEMGIPQADLASFTETAQKLQVTKYGVREDGMPIKRMPDGSIVEGWSDPSFTGDED